MKQNLALASLPSTVSPALSASLAQLAVWLIPLTGHKEVRAVTMPLGSPSLSLLPRFWEHQLQPR